MKTPVEAAVVAAVCGKRRSGFGIRVERSSGSVWRITWAFPLDAAQSRREGYVSESLKGDFFVDEAYPGCPGCGQASIFYCNGCQTVGCWDGGSHASCGSCGVNARVQGTIAAMSTKGDR